MSALLKKLLQVAVPVSAALMSSVSFGAGIADTKHNLGGTGTANHVAATDTGEICVFCHTPHGAATSADNPPLWNKALPASNSYTTYSSTTMDANGVAAGGGVTIGSVSLACLSCHDGTQAMDNIVNATGSGQYLTDGGGAGGRGYTWTGAGATAAGVMQNHGDFIAALGTDLTNDHPIGIAYCGWSNKGGSAVLSNATITSADCSDPDFKTATKASAGGGSMWFVDQNGTSDGTKQKTDMILYTRNFSGVGNGPSVECASCHDPHSSNTTFLRIPNTGSAVCLSCHNK